MIFVASHPSGLCYVIGYLYIYCMKLMEERIKADFFEDIEDVQFYFYNVYLSAINAYQFESQFCLN